MRKVTVRRTEMDDSGTFGKWISDSGFECSTMELPERNNIPGKSCIPPGVYQCEKRVSPKHGPCYYVLNVPGRIDIEIHSANWAGDTSLGFKCQLLGCLAPGRSIGELEGQKAILSSRDALASLESDLNGDPFQLTVEWGV